MRPPVQVLETVVLHASLGVRFRDESSGHFVGDGLVVRAWPRPRALRSQRAYVTPSNVWVLRDLSGPFTLEVLDTLERFLPCSFQAELPHPGLFALTCAPEQPFVPLFSAPARQASPTLAVVRAELWDSSAQAPASWALLQASVGDGPPARGLADEHGRVALFFQYPTPEDFAPGTPGEGPPSHGPPLLEQTWTVRLSAFYAPRAPLPVPPDLCDTLAQPPALLWPDLSGGQDHLSRTLRFGHELIVRTQGDSLSRLRLTPTGSPP